VRLLVFVLALASVSITASARADWLSREEAIMGTRIYVEVWDEDRPHGYAAIEAVMDYMRHVNALMSHFLPDSELSGINARAGVEAVVVDPELFDVIRASITTRS